MSTSKLFQPITIGDIVLRHRVVLAPLTRLRTTSQHVLTDLAVEYYKQRSSTPGTLVISEGTIIATKAGGFPHIPVFETEEQLAAWKKVVDVVHANGSSIVAQIAALGRAADPKILEAEGGFELIGPSDIPVEGGPKPRPLTIPEIKEYVDLFATTATNAVKGVGFDGIELHICNGLLMDQFLQDVSNNRTDDYGGSIENRSRFPLEVINAIVKAVGPTKVGVRLSPWNDVNGMGMKDPVPTFTYFVSRLAQLHPTLAYLHVVEPRAAGADDRVPKEGESNDFIRAIWSPRPFISAGGFTRDLAIEAADTKGELIAFGRHFIANPDLPRRLIANVLLNSYDRSTFYAIGEAEGYTDYPFSDKLKGKDVGI
ncbi:unnamed protein product [Somion occarium]|uniref:NADH:flavin oxidoreductase/NADH oxidase N-terminal domain-containing protein n=1 Tax=Somion occarium TaxID=3059160 RepID=A0ABP1DTQ5_9APHY